MMIEPQRNLPDLHRMVLDYLCRQPAQVYDFADVAKAMNRYNERGKIERAINDLRHQRWGAPLSGVGPDGTRLRPRHAYLPHDSKFRANFPPVPPAPKDAPEHPTITAMKRAIEQKAKEEAEAAAALAKEREERGAVRADYIERKRLAREKAAAEKKSVADGRFRTGFADQNSPVDAPQAPLAPSASLPKKIEPPIALKEFADEQLPAPVYRKNKGDKK